MVRTNDEHERGWRLLLPFNSVYSFFQVSLLLVLWFRVQTVLSWGLIGFRAVGDFVFVKVSGKRKKTLTRYSSIFVISIYMDGFTISSVCKNDRLSLIHWWLWIEFLIGNLCERSVFPFYHLELGCSFDCVALVWFHHYYYY